MTELPAATTSAESRPPDRGEVRPGVLAPLTVVLESDGDLRCSEGLALIDDVSRFLTHQRRLDRGPVGDAAAGKPAPLDRGPDRLPARRRSTTVSSQLADGAGQLQRGA